MENKRYESPKVYFQQMKLLERVADTCWGYAYAWYDADGNGKIEGGHKVSLGSLPGLKEDGCQGDASRNALINYYAGFGVTLSKKDVSTNTKSTIVHGGNS